MNNIFFVPFYLVVCLIFFSESCLYAQKIEKINYVKFNLENTIDDNNSITIRGEYPILTLLENEKEEKTYFLQTIHKEIEKLLLKRLSDIGEYDGLQGMMREFSQIYKENIQSIKINIKASLAKNYIFLNREFVLTSNSMIRGGFTENDCKAYNWFQNKIFEIKLNNLFTLNELVILRSKILEKVKADFSLPLSKNLNEVTLVGDNEFYLPDNFYVENGKLVFFYEAYTLEPGYPREYEISYEELLKLFGANHKIVELTKY